MVRTEEKKINLSNKFKMLKDMQEELIDSKVPENIKRTILKSILS
jgi:hypothetical protein|tara:strand:- start:566 stop:700 length:135 start_codon:yes stop_codon:yes gene_type:complete